MTAARFLETRAPAWDRLEELVKVATQQGMPALTDEQLHELTRLYPATAVDVARARMYGIDPKTQQRLNHLAIAAHGLLYRRARSNPLRAVWRFFRHDYPRLFRRLWPYLTLSFVLFFVTTLGTYLSTRISPSLAYVFVPRGLDLPDGDAERVTAKDISERFRHIPKPPMAAGIISNNISVAFNAFALGITAGIGTCYVILMNSMMLGAFAAHFANHRLAYEFWSFVAPHGFLEIMAILIAAGAGLRLGISLAIPGKVTRRASLRVGAKEAVLLVLGTIPMFIIAGTIEGFITPSFIPGIMKITLGVVAAATVLTYLLFVACRAPAAQATEAQHSDS